MYAVLVAACSGCWGMEYVHPVLRRNQKLSFKGCELVFRSSNMVTTILVFSLFLTAK